MKRLKEIIREELINEKVFGSQAQYDAYRKKHNLKPGTKVKVAGKTVTVKGKGKMSKTAKSTADRMADKLNKKMDALNKKRTQGKVNEVDYLIQTLKELINKLLPDAILAKMQSPALVNRTGRFRRSAEVTNAMIGPKGGVQIDYTYQRDPYGVFEPGSGSPLANQYRDPRAIIGGSVREIAQSIMGKKFVRVRRV